MQRLAVLVLMVLRPFMVSAMEIPVTAGVSSELAQYRAAHISDINYRLHFDIPADPAAPIKASSRVTFELDSLEQPLQLDFRDDRRLLLGLSSNGRSIDIDFRHEHIIVPANELRLGSNTLEIEFLAGSSSLNRNPDYLYTLFVPDRARTAFPLFDQPDLKATYDLALDIPSAWTALANAPLESLITGTEKSRYQFATSDLISSYLFSFVAGQFETIERTVAGRKMTLLHRETDPARFERNVDAIFEQHGRALDWLEAYTGIDYPFKKFGFALIPSFQYSGMEHVGAILYRAESLLLEEEPTDAELLGRASLIAHETAHMWFGNLVTMAWFNDVWTKEVFANLMAAKIVNPLFPAVDHSLNFLVSHHPKAYAVDRSVGANAIRQQLPNLNQAGQMYGDIIYDKAPIMMRQLERLVGDTGFRQGIQRYLRAAAFDNATWPDLIAALDKTTKTDLAAWSQVWVDTPGRPEFKIEVGEDGKAGISQTDPAGLSRVWPQQFALSSLAGSSTMTQQVESIHPTVPLSGYQPGQPVLFNADGMGYGLFPADIGQLSYWKTLTDLQKGALLINLNENLLEARSFGPVEYLAALVKIIPAEQNQLILGLALGQLSWAYSNLLTPKQQQQSQQTVEAMLWSALAAETEPGRARLLYNVYSTLASSAEQLAHLYAIWSGREKLAGVILSEQDQTRLAEILAIRMPSKAGKTVAEQLSRIENPDDRRRLEFIAPSLSADESQRDVFFKGLAEPVNRQTEAWVVDALANLHHPSRTAQSQKYLLPSLELLEEIQATGDIFFPTSWLHLSFQNHGSPAAVALADDFLAARPAYNAQLRMKVQQALDLPRRAVVIRSRSNSEAQPD